MKFDMTKSKASMTGALLLASLIWGSGTVLMQVCIDGGIETGLQMFFRFWIGAFCLGVLSRQKLRQMNRRLWVCGLLCGTLLFFSFFILTLGLEFTTPANSAFLSSSSVMLVPFISWIMLKIRPERKVFFGCFLCLIGVGVLSLQLSGGIHFTTGDSLTLLSAIFFSFYTCTVAKIAGGLDASLFTFVQLLTTAIWSTVTLSDSNGRAKKPAANTRFADSQFRGAFRRCLLGPGRIRPIFGSAGGRRRHYDARDFDRRNGFDSSSPAKSFSIKKK